MAFLGMNGGGHAKGILLAGFSVVVWSFTGLIIRHIDTATDWQIVFYRSAGLTIAIGAFVVLRHRRRTFSTFVATVIHGLVCGACLGVGFVVYLLALRHTTVANVSF